MKILNTVIDVNKVIGEMEKALILMPITEDGVVYVIESSNINRETLKEVENNGMLYHGNVSGRWHTITFFKAIEEIPNATIRNGAKIYEVPINIWYQVVNWCEEEHVRPISIRVRDGIKCGITFGYGNITYLDTNITQIVISTVGEGEIEVEEDPKNLRIKVEYKIKYSWEYGGKQWSDTGTTQKVFYANKINISDKKFVEVVHNWQDPAHAIIYALHIDGTCKCNKSRGATVSYEKEDRGSWSSSDGMLFGGSDIVEVKTLTPIYGSYEKCALEEVPEEVRKDKEWAALEKLALSGGEEYRQKIIEEYKVSEWARIKKEADEYLSILRTKTTKTAL